MGYLRKHYKEVLGTIKLLDVEERFDIYFSRYFGLYFAKIAKWLSMTPTQVSIISLLIGVAGGAMLYYQQQFYVVLLGGIFVVIAGVLDSADGQLARMTGQSSELGRVIDGLIDNFVFMACYIGGTLYLYEIQGWTVFIWAFASGYAHSLKSAIYEFYKTEYLQLVGKAQSGNIPLSIEGVKPEGDKWYLRIIHFLYRDYVRKQLSFTTRKKDQRRRMQQLAFDEKTSSQFDASYARLNKPMLSGWAWICGSNTHRTAMVVSALFANFDLYLYASVIWTLGLIPLSIYQKRQDLKLLESFNDPASR